MNYLTKNGQTIYDLVLNTNGNLNNTYALILANPTIKNLASVPVGLVVAYTPPPVTPPIVASSGIPPAISSQGFRSAQNQTVYDVVLQTYGDLNMTYKLIQDSGFSNVLTYPIATTLFIFNPNLVADAVFAQYLASKGIIINTGNSTTGAAQGGSYDSGFDNSFENGST